jgi:hypothetical protein
MTVVIVVLHDKNQPDSPSAADPHAQATMYWQIRANGGRASILELPLATSKNKKICKQAAVLPYCQP